MSAPPEETSPSDRILEAAENALRRYGPEKTNVVDIARALGMSHGNIYRHFSSKKELLKAVAARWLETVSSPLRAIADDETKPARERLEEWFLTLRAAKRTKVELDPELFRTHYTMAVETQELSGGHIAELLAQLEKIVTDGVAEGEFRTDLEPAAAAKGLLLGMAAFHHPMMILHNPTTEEDARRVMALLLDGLRRKAGA